MGLDGIELVMEFERGFDLRIPDQIAENMITVGDTLRYLIDELNKQKSPSYGNSTARSFYRLRNELMIRYGIPREAVRLDVPIGELIQKKSRHDWASIADIAHLRPERKTLFGHRFPSPEISVRSLIETRSATPWVRVDGSIDENAVFARVQQIIAEQMDISQHEVSPNSRYIEDLGVG